MRRTHDKVDHRSVRAKCRRWMSLLLLTATLCLPLEPHLVAAGLTGTLATEVTISEYSSKDLSLIAQVHAEGIHVDYQHWGFFRIGLLPILVAEDVQVRIQSAKYLTNALADLKAWHQPSSGYRHVELRNLEISVGKEARPRLEAKSAQVGSHGTIKLSDVAVRGTGGQSVHLPQATLQISGPFAGRLYGNKGGHQEDLQILQTQTDKTP